jgi:hypothetical protein
MYVHDRFCGMHRASLLMRRVGSTSWTPQSPTSARCGSLLLLHLVHTRVADVSVCLAADSLVAELPHCLAHAVETCRWETRSNAVRPAACVQVLNCIDYLHKFGYSKEQVSAHPRQLSSVT